MTAWNRLVKTLLIFVAASMCITSLSAFGQSQQEAPSGSPKINLTLEQRHVIKEIVKELKIENSGGDVQVKAGESVPSSVRLQTMPSEVGAKVSQVKAHLFFVKDGQVIVVDPRENKVVEIID